MHVHDARAVVTDDEAEAPAADDKLANDLARRGLSHDDPLVVALRDVQSAAAQRAAAKAVGRLPSPDVPQRSHAALYRYRGIT